MLTGRKGISLTNENVRQTIGGGSFRDIRPLVKSIKIEMAAKEQADRQAPDMPDDFHDAAAAMWNTAWTLADEIAASERRGHAAEIEKLRAEADEAISNCGVVEDERDAAQASAMASESLLDQVRAALRDAELEIAMLKGRLAEREDAILQCAKSAKAQKTHDAPIVDDGSQPDMFPEESSGTGAPEIPKVANAS